MLFRRHQYYSLEHLQIEKRFTAGSLHHPRTTVQNSFLLPKEQHHWAFAIVWSLSTPDLGFCLVVFSNLLLLQKDDVDEIWDSGRVYFLSVPWRHSIFFWPSLFHWEVSCQVPIDHCKVICLVLFWFFLPLFPASNFLCVFLGFQHFTIMSLYFPHIFPTLLDVSYHLWVWDLPIPFFLANGQSLPFPKLPSPSLWPPFLGLSCTGLASCFFLWTCVLEHLVSSLSRHHLHTGASACPARLNQVTALPLTCFPASVLLCSLLWEPVQPFGLPPTSLAGLFCFPVPVSTQSFCLAKKF